MPFDAGKEYGFSTRTSQCDQLKIYEGPVLGSTMLWEASWSRSDTF